MEKTTINNNNMEEKLIFNSAEDAEIISVRLSPDETPIAYENRVRCLMLSGLSREEAEKIAYNGILMNYWDVYDCMDEVEEPTDDDWLNAVSNLFDSYTYDVKNTDVDKFKMSDVMNVYRIINL